MLVQKRKRENLPPRSTNYIYLGYGTDGKFGYRLWDPEHQRLVQRSDIVFNEHIICMDNVEPKSGKRVNFGLASESRGSC